jgi:hypothetical protein
MYPITAAGTTSQRRSTVADTARCYWCEQGCAA